jgi:two-component system response regulator DegU
MTPSEPTAAPTVGSGRPTTTASLIEGVQKDGPVSIKLMLVDDHRTLREGLRRSLEEEGFEIVGEASDGYEAVLRVPELNPDVILMDVSMPNVGGIEATRRIVANEPERRVVMLTMHADRDIVEMAIKAGAVGYLTKDCSIEELADAMRLAAGGETALSPQLARTMLTEVRRIDVTAHTDDERLVSRREEEVLQLIADGCSTPEVAERLFISQKTVKNHLASIYEKLNARDRTQAVLTAVKMGIIKLT